MADAGPAVMAAVFAYPRDADERRTRVYYASVFVLAKTCALALAFTPPAADLNGLLLGLSVVNLLFSFLLDACARRETKRWAGEKGVETYFYHCLLETVLGAWTTHKLIDQVTALRSGRTAKGGSIVLPDSPLLDPLAEAEESIQPADASSGQIPTSEISLEDWAEDITWTYNAAMLVKKALAIAVVVLRFLFERWKKPKALDIAARIISSFVSLVLVDLIDGLAKEESRLRSRPKAGVFSKLFGWLY